MADVQKLASILAEGGMTPAEYAILFEKNNSSSTSSSAAAGGGGETKPKKVVKKTTKTETEDKDSEKSSDSPTRLSPKYKVELRKIIAERFGIAIKADQDKILDKFTKDWIKSKHPEDYHDKLKFTESVAREFIDEQFPHKKEEAKSTVPENEDVEVVEKTIVIDGKPTVVYYDAKSNDVYDDKDNLIGKLDADGAFVAL
jgi:hypothetical protein